MYVESDSYGRTIIQDLTGLEASFIHECVTSYLADKKPLDRTSEHVFLNDLKKQLETNKANG